METRVRARTLAEALSRRAADTADRIAYTFLPDGDDESHSWTFAELARLVRGLAARMSEEVTPGARALIVAPDSADFVAAFLACQFAGVIAVPVYPPFPATSPRRLETLRAIAENSAATAILCAHAQDTRRLLTAAAPELGQLRWIDIAAADPAEDFEPVPRSGSDVSFLQYTSGSTAAPKGVAVTHEALMYNQELLCQAMGYGEDSRIVGWLPLFHDMGLMGTMVPAVYAGSRAVLMPPLAFVQRPVRWLRAVTRYAATITGGPNFAYELCCRRIPAADRAELDLATLAVAFNGAEPIRAATLAAFAAEFGPHGFDPNSFYPCYGLAESTLMTTGARLGAGAVTLSVNRDELAAGRLVPGGDQRLVGSGRPALHRELLIVDPETRVPVAEGGVGEIWIGGPDAALAYWNEPEATEATFRAETAAPRSGPYLRSGDLGAVVDGELYVVGRRKDLVIIGGRNYYPQDIEHTVENADPLVRRGCVAAFAVDGTEGEQLVVVAEVKAEGDPDFAALTGALRSAVTVDHSITPGKVVLVRPGSVPKTSSGKLQRRATRAAFEAGTLDEIALAARSATEGARR